MKVLVYFQPSPKHDYFEGARMRKTIKGALEVINTAYTSNILDDYDVAHFMSPDDENKLNIVLERKIPVVVSALFGEADPSTRFLNYKSKDGKRITTIKPKALRMLNKADLILVPCKTGKEFLIANGVNKPIEVCVPGVNLSRFNFSREDEKELFYRYFREDKNKKLVVALGEYAYNLEGIHAVINAAVKRPDVTFYYVGDESFALTNRRSKKIIKNSPKNMHFIGIPTDDIYRSMLLNADVFMLPGYNYSGFISIEEAMAYESLIKEYDLLQEELAERLSKGRSTITNSMRLLKLSEEVRNLVITGELSSGHARTLIPVEDSDLQAMLARKIIAEKLSVRDAERLVKNALKPAAEKAKVDTQLESAYLSMVERLKTIIGTNVNITRNKKGRGKIEIEYYSKDELDRIIDLISGN